jgi:hypothetical protein
MDTATDKRSDVLDHKIYITTSDDGELVATKGSGSSITFAVLRKDENDVLCVSSTNVSGQELDELGLEARRVNEMEGLV